MDSGQYYQKDVDDLRKLPGARFVSPIVWSWGYLFGRVRNRAGGRLMGVEPSFLITFIFVCLWEGE